MSLDDSQSLRVPRLPRLAALPLGALPGVVHSHALAAALTRVFAAPLKDGELWFLEGRVLRINTAHRLSLGSINDELAVVDVVPQRRQAAHPHAFFEAAILSRIRSLVTSRSN